MLLTLTDTNAVIRAIEDNAAELLLTMGRAGGGEEHNQPHIRWTIGGSPIDYHNAVVKADLTRTSLSVDVVIDRVIQELQAHQVPGSWHVGPSFLPADLGTHLVAHGFEHAGGEPGMAVDLLTTNEQIAYPSTLSIERVRDNKQLQIWAATLAQSFGEGEREANWVRDVYQTFGFGDDIPFRHYLGWLDGEPVGTTTLFLSAGVAGIYFVMTVPQARRQGIGAALTVAALRDARELGYRVGVLGSSQAGYPLYQRIGFKEYCQLNIYEWKSSLASDP